MNFFCLSIAVNTSFVPPAHISSETVFVSLQVRELRHLFNDDTVFIALSSSEKFPDEGFDIDVQSECCWNIIRNVKCIKSDV